ncbi:16S rRNA pseudouridine(516) synthase [Mycoplasma todarodis]|uniref:Pseudouridine synthase n=1 Tax=Mycoplasma todarodis TaxID=1937191 RepID=A0A4R0XL03_9MOLU|nr:16S rRNA pseudouridine(516) synthase [Mycoplasma todarodis]
MKSKRVFVNGVPQQDIGYKVDPEKDIIEFNHEKVAFKKHVYIALNKPKDFVCANKDNLHKTVFDIVDVYKHKNMFVVGRLDKDTTGLVILTDDGKWAHELKSPKSNTEKEYFVTLKNDVKEEDVLAFKGPMHLDEKLLKPALIKDVTKNECNVIISEGKFHQVKRMFHKVNNEVLELHRTRIKDIKLSDFELKIGEYTEFEPKQ